MGYHEVWNDFRWKVVVEMIGKVQRKKTGRE